MFLYQIENLLMHKDLKILLSWDFRGWYWLKKMYQGVQIKISEGVKPNDYSITILDRGGSSQMITVDYNTGRGSKKIKLLLRNT